MDLKDLLNSDNTLLLSSPKYLNRFASDEQVLELVNGLFTRADALRPPRITDVRLPFGQPISEPGNVDQQPDIVQDALRLLNTASKPGTLGPLPCRWRRDDYSTIGVTTGNILASIPLAGDDWIHQACLLSLRHSNI